MEPIKATDATRTSLELLYKISRDLASALDLRTVLQRVLILSTANVEAERGSMIVLDDRGEQVEAAIAYGKRVHSSQQLRETLDKGLAGWVAHHLKPVLVADTSLDERWLRRSDDAVERSGAKSAICVPLLARSSLVGVLTVVHPQPGYFSPEHLALMQSIADQAGVAVLNARLYAESQRQARVMTALAENAVTINATLNLEEVLQRILDQTAQALRMEVVLLGLIDPARQDLEFRAVTGKRVSGIVGLRRALGKGVAGRVAQTGQGMVLTDATSAEAEQLPGLAVRALVCAPVHAHGRIIGVLEGINPISGTMEPDALLVLAGIGSLAGTAIHNAQLFEQLQIAHQRYHELFDDSIDMILITDGGGHILEANRQALRATGYSQRAFQALTIDSLHPVNIEKVGPRFEKVVGRAPISYESLLRVPDKTATPIQVYVRTVDVQGTECLQWILRDITERKERDALREDLLAMIYHDLSSPLANVVSSLDLLESILPEESDPSARTVLRIATRSTERIQRLVASLLDVYLLESGQSLTNYQSCDASLIMSEAMEIVAPTAEGKQQTLESDVPAGIPAVWVLPDMIRRVLINLLENASKYSEPGSQIHVGAERAGDKVLIWVQDSGPGIPPESRELIFHKFTRLRAENSPRGLGLGLAFCRLAVEAHGGRIWVDSVPEGGSRFQFTLPVSMVGE